MGELFRRYWHPIAASSMLIDNPVRKVTILGEELVLYRDRSGDLGLITPRCAHRSVHLQFGIPDVHGLRCPYHGWCYDATGQCTDTPLELPNSRLKQHINIGGYPVQELGGLVFAYLGPDPVPLLPRWPFLVHPNSLRQIGITTVPCNWLQCHENSADPLHRVWLHGHFFQYQLERKGLLETRALDHTTHTVYLSQQKAAGYDEIVTERTKYGFRKGVHYPKGAPNYPDQEHTDWAPYNIFPYYSTGSGAFRTQCNMRVPMDDTHTFHISYELYHAPDGVEAPIQDTVPWFEAPLYDEQGEPILDYVLAQDMAAWWSQGAIVDRTKENLAGSDLALIEFRRIIEEQIQTVEAGRDPMNVFRDPDEIGECIDIPEYRMARARPNPGPSYGYRIFYEDDVDRYGPVAKQAAEMIGNDLQPLQLDIAP